HVPDVVVTVLHRAGEIGMARSWPRHRLAGGARGRSTHRHGALPVLPVAILDRQADRAAERQSPADTRGDVGAVLLDLHAAAAAAVASLTARQILVDVVFGQGEAGWHAVDDGGQGLSVGLS